MAQFYTLEEAATRLGISPEEFRRRLKLEWTSIRPFRDGATLRFRAADIDELARSLGAASDPGLQLGAPGAGPTESGPGDSSDEIAFPLPTPKSGTKLKPAKDVPLDLGDDSSDFTLPTADSGISSSPKKKKGDSDVRLEHQTPKAAPDPESALPTEEIALDLSGPGSGIGKSGASSNKLSAPKSGVNLGGPKSASRIPSPTSGGGDKENTDSSSEFELSLDADSDSFELQMHTDSSDEVDLGSIGLAPEERGTGGQSGINLNRPADSGVSLEKKGPKSASHRPPPPADDDDLDLSLDPTPVPASGKSGPLAKTTDDSSSEFELSLDDSSSAMEALAQDAHRSGEGGDIFETDFELPVVDDSGSEVVAIDAADTDLESTGFEVDASELDAPLEDDSASEVVLVDDETEVVTDDGIVLEDDADVLDNVELDDTPSASKALRGVPKSRRGADDEDDDVMGVTPSRTIVQTPAKWGALPVAVLVPCFLLLFLGALMSYESVRGMTVYQQPSQPGGLLVRGMADALGMKMVDSAAK